MGNLGRPLVLERVRKARIESEVALGCAQKAKELTDMHGQKPPEENPGIPYALLAAAFTCKSVLTFGGKLIIPIETERGDGVMVLSGSHFEDIDR